MGLVTIGCKYNIFYARCNKFHHFSFLYHVNQFIYIFAHMRILFIVALSFCALIIDYYIYKHISKRWARLLYLCYAVAVDLLIFAFIFIAYRWPFYGIRSISPLPLWFAWFFFLNAIPKCVWFLLHWISKCVHRIAIALALCVAFFLFKGALYNTRRFQVKPIVIESSKIPPSFNNYKIALFSDVHLGNLSRQESFLKRFVAQVNQYQPDIILFAGDLVNMYAIEISPEVQAILSQLQAPDGIFSVLGNHDMGPYFGKQGQKIGLTPLGNTAQVVQKEQEMGWRVLYNQSIYIHRNNDSIALCGVPYPPSPPIFPDSLTHFDLALATRQLDSAHFNIMLCHTPKVWETMLNHPALQHIDLTLSGHTHAMQAKITINARQWSPAQWMYKYWSGLYERDGRYLYVNDGLGYVLYPMRVGTKPEITLITLRSK